MSVLIEDSPRNLCKWIVATVSQKNARGAVITPFATPWVGKRHRRSARDMAEMVRAAGGEVWFDATTHALQAPAAGDFRYYNEYSLWGGTFGQLDSRPARVDHVTRVFATQDALKTPHLGPTVLLHHGETTTSQRALDLSKEALAQDSTCWLSIAGSPSFWASGHALDAHVASLAQLDPAGWFLTVVRPLSAVPVAAEPEEVHGLCRTTRALGEYAPVHISHGDLAALPAVAAGASSIGTGWDQRQRVFSYDSFGERPEKESGGGGWFQRPTLQGLLGALKQDEARLLANRDSVRAARLGPIPAPGPEEAFQHHSGVLRDVVQSINAQVGFRQRYDFLVSRYQQAALEWPSVVQITSSALDETDWVNPFLSGLQLYGQTEGW